MNHEWKESFLKGRFIYYSNVLDLRSHFYAVNLSNISTQNLIAEDYRYSPSYSNIFKPKPGGGGVDRHSPVAIYYREQAYRFTKFYLHKPEFIPFKQPEELILRSTYSGNNRYLNLDGFQNYDDRTPFINIEQSILNSICKKYYVADEHELELTLDTEKTKAAIQQLYKLNFAGIGKAQFGSLFLFIP
jgi:hypothetical protein